MTIFLMGCLGVLYVAGLSLIDLRLCLGSLVLEYWQVLTILTSLPTLVTISLRFYFSEETPHFLITKGRYEEAHSVLERMVSDNKSNVLLPSLDDFMKGRRQSISQIDSTTAGLVDIFSHRPMQLTVPLLLIWFLQSITYWGFTMFLPSFFISAGVNANLSIFCMVSAELPGGVLAAFMMDSHGRITTLRIYILTAFLFSAVTCVASMLHTQILLVVGSVGIYMFLIPVWSLLFVLTPESYPTYSRATAMAVFQNAQAIPGLFTPFLSASSADGTPWHYMFMWTIILGLNCIVSSFWLKKPTLENPYKFHQLVNDLEG